MLKTINVKLGTKAVAPKQAAPPKAGTVRSLETNHVYQNDQTFDIGKNFEVFTFSEEYLNHRPSQIRNK